mmetsp:Transcript_271/g.516  ORF Transcript_271/g.516 Transcript_271/m.516 type:complete len:214 (+) Transcript_271:644-1285(+)
MRMGVVLVREIAVFVETGEELGKLEVGLGVVGVHLNGLQEVVLGLGVLAEGSVEFSRVAQEELVAGVVIEGPFEALEGGLGVTLGLVLNVGQFALIVEDHALGLLDQREVFDARLGAAHMNGVERLTLVLWGTQGDRLHGAWAFDLESQELEDPLEHPRPATVDKVDPLLQFLWGNWDERGRSLILACLAHLLLHKTARLWDLDDLERVERRR